MPILLFFLVEHCHAGYGFNSYPIAHQSIQQSFPAPQLENSATLPPLIEMPQLGEGAQVPQTSGPEVRPEERTCPPCPAPAPPTDCPHQHLECPELICDTVKVNVDVEDEIAHHRNLVKEEELMRMRLAKRQRRQLEVDSVVELSNKCNEKRLKRIMLESISSNIVVSKVTIAERASREIGGNFGVICTSGVFSYYVTARIFCEATRDTITCFAFRQDDFNSGSQKSLRKMDTSLLRADEEMTERDTEVKPLEEPPTATMYEMDMMGTDRITSTSASVEEMKEYGLYDAQTRLLLEENFEELIAELEKRQQALKRQMI